HLSSTSTSPSNRRGWCRSGTLATASEPNHLLDTPDKGKSRSTLSESFVALSAYRDELANRLWILGDRRMG
ncbi:MAG: hypothetical protein LQ347_003917, partial [Umbilicaria vellea]